MLAPWSRAAPPRPPCALDAWTRDGFRLLEAHALDVAAAPEAALSALVGLRLNELPAVRALFALRGLAFSADMTLGEFFETPPFATVERDAGREVVGGILIPARGSAREAARTPERFREALRTAPFAALATFRADPREGGARLWTETWVCTRGAGPAITFGAYWLAIGPFSAWIRRMWLRAARTRAEGG